MESPRENEEFDLLPQEEGEDVTSILAEMEALQAVFDADFRKGPMDRAQALVRQALEVRTPPTTTEGRLTVVALSHCLGTPRRDLALVRPKKSRKWFRKTFDSLATGWMRWLTMGDMAVLGTIAKMHEGSEDDGAVETLSLNFWAQAIELLAQGDREGAKRFFERATEVGAQFGTSTNPTICWTYAASYFSLP